MLSQPVYFMVVNSRSNYFLKNSQGKIPQSVEQSELEIKNYDLNTANRELADEVNYLNKKIYKLRAIHIEDIHY